MMTGTRRPTLRLSRLALIDFWAFISRCQRASFTSSGTAAADVVGSRAVDRLVAEAADAIEPGVAEPVEEGLEIILALAREADDEGRADGEIGTDVAPAPDALQRLVLVGGPAHRLEHRRRGVLERDVEIGQHLAVGHQRDHRVDVRIGIDVVEPDPDAELAEGLGQIDESRRNVAVAPAARRVFQVEPIGARVLRDDEELLDARRDQPLGLAQNLAGRAADKVAAQLRNDAEAAAIVAAFGDFQIGVVARRQLDALRRHEVHARVVRRRQRLVNGRDDALVLLRPGHGQHLRKAFADQLRLGPHAAGDDDLAVRLERLADGRERFGLGRIEEAAGVDDDRVSARVVLAQDVALGAQLRDDSLRIDERLRAAERDEGDAGRGLGHAA